MSVATKKRDVGQALSDWEQAVLSTTLPHASGGRAVDGAWEATRLNTATGKLGNCIRNLAFERQDSNDNSTTEDQGNWLLRLEVEPEVLATVLLVAQAIGFLPPEGTPPRELDAIGNPRYWRSGQVISAVSLERVARARRLLQLATSPCMEHWRGLPVAERIEAAMAAISNTEFRMPKTKKAFFDLFSLNRGQVNRSFPDLDRAYRTRMAGEAQRGRPVMAPSDALSVGLHPQRDRSDVARNK